MKKNKIAIFVTIAVILAACGCVFFFRAPLLRQFMPKLYVELAMAQSVDRIVDAYKLEGDETVERTFDFQVEDCDVNTYMNRLFKGITASATIVRDKDNHKLSVEASAGVGGISLVKAQLYSDGEILVTEASRFSNNSYYITNETISSYLNEKNIDISPYNDKPLESLFDDGTVLTKYFEDIRSELKDAEIEKMGRKIIECDGLDVETTCYSMESDTYSLLLYIDDDFNVIMTEARSNGYTIRVKCDDENREFTQGILHIEGDNMLLELEYKYSYKILEDESIEELPTDSAVNIEDIGDFDFESIIPDGIINFD